LKAELENASKKAVKEGSERASAETKVKILEKEVETLKGEKEDLAKKVEALEKKVATLTTLHKEQEGRMSALRKEKEGLEEEIKRLKKGGEGGIDDEGMDELEDEERRRLEQRIRELEAENTDLRRGIWIEKRKEMQMPPEGETAVRFESVDLDHGGHLSPHVHAHGSKKGGGLGDLLATGLNVLTGGGTTATAGGGAFDDLLDDDMEFDEEAFRRAQEEEQKARIERIKELKRTLKNWEGWRLDLVDIRRGGGEGIGEIFEV